jgi:hypothetical protein
MAVLSSSWGKDDLLDHLSASKSQNCWLLEMLFGVAAA